MIDFYLSASEISRERVVIFITWTLNTAKALNLDGKIMEYGDVKKMK